MTPPAIVEGELFVPKQVAAFAFELSFDDVRKRIVRRVDQQVESPTAGAYVVECRGEGECWGGAVVEGADHHLDFRIVKGHGGRVCVGE